MHLFALTFRVHSLGVDVAAPVRAGQLLHVRPAQGLQRRRAGSPTGENNGANKRVHITKLYLRAEVSWQRM